MRRDSLRLLLLIGVIAFAVLYGMELSSSGIKNVYGPMDQLPSQRPAEQTDDGTWSLPPDRTQTHPEAVPSETGGTGESDPEAYFPRTDRQPLVDRVSGTTAEALHELSSGGIRFVVSLFDRMTGS